MGASDPIRDPAVDRMLGGHPGANGAGAAPVGAGPVLQVHTPMGVLTVGPETAVLVILLQELGARLARLVELAEAADAFRTLTVQGIVAGVREYGGAAIPGELLELLDAIAGAGAGEPAGGITGELHVEPAE